MASKNTFDRRSLYAPPVLLIALVWLIFLTLHLLVSAISEEYAANNIELAITSSVGFLWSWTLYRLSRRLRHMEFRSALPPISASALVASTIVRATNVLLQFWIGSPLPPKQPIFSWPGDYFVRLRYGWLYFSQLFVLQAVIFALIRYAKALDAQKKELVDARLAALRLQLNPHFLFNTLNAISSLVGVTCPGFFGPK